MSNNSSDTKAESGVLDNASVAPCTLAACSSQELQKLINESNWHNPDIPGFNERFAAQQYHFSDAAVRDCPSVIESELTTSSMAAPSVATARSSAFTNTLSSGYMPSLVSRSTRHDEQSVRTSRADSVLNLETLDDDVDGTTNTTNIQPHRVLTCCYSFLSCNFESRNLEQWDTHCKSHFRGRVPRFLDCPFRCNWTREAASGEEAWQARMIHIWSVHGLQGLVDNGRRPSPSLIQHLWKEGIVTMAQVKELKTLGRLSGSVYLSSAGQVHEDRIRRRSRAGGLS